VRDVNKGEDERSAIRAVVVRGTARNELEDAADDALLL
jgi:hypothetical protein